MALFTTWYNWVRIHKTLRGRPAMQAGPTDRLRGMDWIVSLVDGGDSTAAPRRPYRRQRKRNT